MKKAKPRDSNKKAERADACFRKLKNAMTASIAIKINWKRERPQELYPALKQ